MEECDQCKPYNRPQEEIELKDSDDHVSFHWYDTLPFCSIHKILPKYPPGPDPPTGKKKQTKSCAQCNAQKAIDPDFECGKFRKRVCMIRQRKPFQEFYHKYYIPTLKNTGTIVG